MTPERLRRLRQLHAVCVEADCRVSAKSLGECLDEIERMREINERQAEALRAVCEAWDCGAVVYVADEGGEAIDAVRRALEADGR